MKIGLVTFSGRGKAFHVLPTVGSCVFIEDRQARHDVDLYICSVYDAEGWEAFKKFSVITGRQNIIAGGFYPSEQPEETYKYAWKVVTGNCSNIDEIIAGPPGIM